MIFEKKKTFITNMSLKQVTGRKMLCKMDLNKTKESKGGFLLVNNKENYDVAEVLQVGGKCTEIVAGQKVLVGNGRGHKPDLEDDTIKVIAEYDTIVGIKDNEPPQAIGNRVVAQLMPRPVCSDTIYLPDHMRYQFDTALVVSIGKDLDEKELLKPGAKIVFPFGQGSPLEWNGEKYLIIQEEIILLVLEKTNE